ncbi:hypothetical protein GGI10_001285 [Coemansia sp. RSA 2530]|nr:hypothetical protein GGI10_001285 [Coemansia sp. RSA 2530]
MDDVAALGATVAAAAAASAAATDDFGLIDYESPGPDPLPDTEEAEDLEHESAADDLIDYEEIEDDGPHASIAAPTTAVNDVDELRMDFDDGDEGDEPVVSIAAPTVDMASGELGMDYDEDTERLEQSLLDSHLSSASEQEPVIPVAELGDETLIGEAEAVVEAEADAVAEAEADMIAEAEADAVAVTYGEQPHALNDTDVPETWVFSDGEWMIYLGPNQHSYGADYQSTLFAMPLDQLISALHSDILLREDMELALEFPSLALTIDQLSEDLVNSPSLKRIMQIVAEDAQTSSHPVPVPQEEPKVAANGAVPVPAAATDTEQVNDVALVVDLEEAVDEPEATTADLLADADEEEEGDEDYVAEGEEEGDFELEEDDDEEEADEIDDDIDDDLAEAEGEGVVEEDEDDVADVEGNETRVESTNASPTHKRTQDSMVEVVPDCDAPAAKKSRSEDAIVQSGDENTAAAHLP